MNMSCYFSTLITRHVRDKLKVEVKI